MGAGTAFSQWWCQSCTMFMVSWQRCSFFYWQEWHFAQAGASILHSSLTQYLPIASRHNTFFLLSINDLSHIDIIVLFMCKHLCSMYCSLDSYHLVPSEKDHGLCSTLFIGFWFPALNIFMHSDVEIKDTTMDASKVEYSTQDTPSIYPALQTKMS